MKCDDVPGMISFIANMLANNDVCCKYLRLRGVSYVVGSLVRTALSHLPLVLAGHLLSV